jgi:hypothetical protein
MSTHPIDTSAAGLRGLFAAFESQEIPKAAWTHEAHLLVGLCYVLQSSDPLSSLRTGINRLNAAQGVATTPTGGYHETLTRFYVWALREYVKGQRERLGDEIPIERLAPGALTALPRELPLLYYSREQLFSTQARYGWVEPDLRPLAALPGTRS